MSLMIKSQLQELGFSRYEIACYLALVTQHPINGSQISRLAGVARSKVYDVLRNMVDKGLVGEAGNGLYVPLPPDELFKRLRLQFESNLSLFRQQISRFSSQADHEHLWSLRGYEHILAKARTMIHGAKEEIYLRCFAREVRGLEEELRRVEAQGVNIRFISLGPAPVVFPVQVEHPDSEDLDRRMGGRALDLIVDKTEAITGLIENGPEEEVSLFWTSNRWFIIASRDSLRHDFYHYFLHKTVDLSTPLDERDLATYRLVKEEI